jgi:hypothetical protein
MDCVRVVGQDSCSRANPKPGLVLAAGLADPALTFKPPLPVPGCLSGLLPENLIKRGSVVGLFGTETGSTSLALSILEVATRMDWSTAVVGLTDLDWAAAQEFGVSFDRLFLVPHPAGRGPEVAGALIDGFDLVVLGPIAAMPMRLADRLATRARQRRTVLLLLAGELDGTPGSWRRSWWPVPCDISLTVTANHWEGIGQGYGHLTHRQIDVAVAGRRIRPATSTIRLQVPVSPGVYPPLGGAAPLLWPKDHASAAI